MRSWLKVKMDRKILSPQEWDMVTKELVILSTQYEKSKPQSRSNLNKRRPKDHDSNN